jgi:hypothetical protein
MTRRDQIRMFVLDVIADDYEEIEHITEVVEKWLGVCKLEITRDEIVQALITLIQENCARAYHLTGMPGHRPEEIKGVPSPDQIQLRDPYFLITDKGVQEVNLPDDGWPFDDEGALRTEWVPPEG